MAAFLSSDLSTTTSEQLVTMLRWMQGNQRALPAHLIFTIHFAHNCSHTSTFGIYLQITFAQKYSKFNLNSIFITTACWSNEEGYQSCLDSPYTRLYSVHCTVTTLSICKAVKLTVITLYFTGQNWCYWFFDITKTRLILLM